MAGGPIGFDPPWQHCTKQYRPWRYIGGDSNVRLSRSTGIGTASGHRIASPEKPENRGRTFRHHRERLDQTFPVASLMPMCWDASKAAPRSPAAYRLQCDPARCKESAEWQPTASAIAIWCRYKHFLCRLVVVRARPPDRHRRPRSLAAAVGSVASGCEVCACSGNDRVCVWRRSQHKADDPPDARSIIEGCRFPWYAPATMPSCPAQYGPDRPVFPRQNPQIRKLPSPFISCPASATMLAPLIIFELHVDQKPRLSRNLQALAAAC